MRQTAIQVRSGSAGTAAWFSSAPHWQWAVGPSGRIRVPHGPRHARRVGAITTACGINAVTWEVFWDQPFAGWLPDTCHDCREALRAGS